MAVIHGVTQKLVNERADECLKWFQLELRKAREAKVTPAHYSVCDRRDDLLKGKPSLLHDAKTRRAACKSLARVCRGAVMFKPLNDCLPGAIARTVSNKLGTSLRLCVQYDIQIDQMMAFIDVLVES